MSWCSRYLANSTAPSISQCIPSARVLLQPALVEPLAALLEQARARRYKAQEGKSMQDFLRKGILFPLGTYFRHFMCAYALV